MKNRAMMKNSFFTELCFCQNLLNKNGYVMF